MEQKSHITVLGFGVRFELWFWVSMAFVAARTESLKLGSLWIVIVTISILIHELGHALAYRRYGAEARITMWGLGGLTHGSNVSHLTPQQRIVIAAAGSTVEMLTLGFPAMILQQTWNPGGWTGTTLHLLVWVNVTWALINLAPVWPMDGGHIVDEVLFLKSGTSRRQLVHRISIATGVVAAAICWSNGLSFGMFLFLFFVVINLFAAGIWRTKTNVMLWPGVTTAEGSREEAPRARKATTGDMMGAGYASLANAAPRLAQQEANRVMSTSRSAKKKREATELLVWSSVVAGDQAEARLLFDELKQPPKSLGAVMLLAEGHDKRGIDELATALQAEADLPASEQAILYAGRSGHIVPVVEALLADGTVGLGHAVRVQYVLEAAELHDAHQAVSSLI